MLLTIKCMGVAFLAGYLVGVPLVWLARRGGQLSRTDWLYAPFVGLSAATLFAQQLVYLDLRLAWSVPITWGLVAALWIGLGLRCGWDAPFRNCPWPLLLAALGVYAVHGLGLLIAGPDLYVGRYHTDRFNYNCIAQYLIDVPFSTGWDGLGQRAYLADAAKLVWRERIGAEVLQGFLAVSSGERADRLFEPLILLAPALVFSALVLIGRALNFAWPHAVLAATAGALLPALTTLHTFCFLANVAGIPFVLAAVAATGKLVADPTARKAQIAAALYAGAAALYTEFTPILFAIALGGLVFGVLLGAGRARASGRAVLAAGLLALAVFPKSTDVAHFRTVYKTTLHTQKDHPISWIQGESTFGAVWVCDVWSVDPSESRRRTVSAVGIALTALGALGLVRLALGALTRRGRDPTTAAPGAPTAAAARVTALLVVCVAASPILLFADGKHDYHAMKLALSFAPLWAVALAAALRPWGEAGGPGPAPTRAGRIARGAALAALVLPVVVCGCGTGALVVKLTGDTDVERSFHRNAMNPEFNALRCYLRNIPTTDVVLGVGPGFIANGELSFAAARHRVWLACVQINDRQALGCVAPDPSLRSLREGRHLVDLTTVPATALVVTLNTPTTPLKVEGAKELVKRIGPYDVWRVGPGPYELIATEHAMRPPELDHPSPPKKK